MLVIGRRVQDEALVRRIRQELDGAEAWLVAPAFARNRVEHVLSDIDDRVDEADEMVHTSERALEAGGVNVAGRGVGDADPLLAIEDVLNGFPADRILLVTHDGEAARWAEADVFEKAIDRFPLPIERLGVTGEGGERVTEAARAEAGAGEGPAELKPRNYVPPIRTADAAGLTVGVLGTIVLVILAATAPGDFLEWPGSAQLGLAIYSALVNLGHAVGLLLMNSVGHRRGPEKFFASLSLIGTPIAVLASVVIALAA